LMMWSQPEQPCGKRPEPSIRRVFMPSAQLARLPPVWLSLYD